MLTALAAEDNFSGMGHVARGTYSREAHAAKGADHCASMDEIGGQPGLPGVASLRKVDWTAEREGDEGYPSLATSVPSTSFDDLESSTRGSEATPIKRPTGRDALDEIRPGEGFPDLAR